MRWQSVAAGAFLVVLAAVAVVAFTRGGEPAQVVASPAASPSPSPSPSPNPSPSPSPSAELVLPENDVDDPLEAIVAIEAYRDWLFENPDPDKVRFIYHPECGCTGPLQEVLRALVADGERFVFHGTTRVVELEVVRRDTERIVLVEYRQEVPPLDVVDAQGRVQESEGATTSPRLRVSLVRSDGGRWLVVSASEA